MRITRLHRSYEPLPFTLITSVVLMLNVPTSLIAYLLTLAWILLALFVMTVILKFFRAVINDGPFEVDDDNSTCHRCAAPLPPVIGGLCSTCEDDDQRRHGWG